MGTFWGAGHRFLVGPVHSLDLTVCPRMLHFREPMLDAIFSTPHVKHVGHVSRRWAVGTAQWKGELDAFVRENRMNLVRGDLDERHEEGLKCTPSLDHPELEFSGCLAQMATTADEPFMSEIGGLLPIALWGRTVL